MPCHSCIQSLITSGKELGPPNHGAKSLTLFGSPCTALEWVMGRPFPPPQWTLLCQIRCVCTTLPAVFVYKKPRQEPVEWCGWHKVPTGDLESSPTLQPKFPVIFSCHVMSCHEAKMTVQYSSMLFCKVGLILNVAHFMYIQQVWHYCDTSPVAGGQTSSWDKEFNQKNKIDVSFTKWLHKCPWIN